MGNDKELEGRITSGKLGNKEIVCDIAPKSWEPDGSKFYKPCGKTYPPGSLPKCTLKEYHECLKNKYKNFGGHPVNNNKVNEEDLDNSIYQ